MVHDIGDGYTSPLDNNICLKTIQKFEGATLPGLTEIIYLRNELKTGSYRLLGIICKPEESFVLLLFGCGLFPFNGYNKFLFKSVCNI